MNLWPFGKKADPVIDVPVSTATGVVDPVTHETSYPVTSRFVLQSVCAVCGRKHGSQGQYKRCAAKAHEILKQEGLTE